MRKINENVNTFRAALMLVMVCMISQSCDDQGAIPEVDLQADEYGLNESQMELVKTTQTVLFEGLSNLSNLTGRETEDVLQTDLFLEQLSSAINTEDFEFTNVDEELYDNSSHGEELTFSIADLSPEVLAHLEHFQQDVDHIITQYENGQITEEESVDMIKSACASEGQLSLDDSSLAQEEKDALASTFYMLDQLTPGIADYVAVHEGANVSNGRFFRRLARAIARVVVAVAVTAVIVAVPVAAVAVVKGAKVAMAMKMAGKAVIGASKITAGKAKFKLSAPLMSGMSAGLKNASKNWDKSWKGAEEFTFGYKVKL